MSGTVSAPVSVRQRIWPWVPSLLYMALIAFLSSQPRLVLDFDFRDFPLRDKGVHFVEFAALAVMNAFAFARTLRSPTGLRVALCTIVLTATYGYLDEVHQAFVPGRTSDAYDLLADLLGSIAGAAAYFIARLVLKKR